MNNNTFHRPNQKKRLLNFPLPQATPRRMEILETICACVYICMHIYTVYVYTYIHTYIHTYIRTYIHTYIHLDRYILCLCLLVSVSISTLLFPSTSTFRDFDGGPIQAGTQAPSCVSWSCGGSGVPPAGAPGPGIEVLQNLN